MFSLVVDTCSKWPEVFNMKMNTQASKWNFAFNSLFTRFGFSENGVADNGAQYKSNEFCKFLKRKLSNILLHLHITQALALENFL